MSRPNNITELYRLECVVNHNPIELWIEPNETLLHLLRQRLRLTGAKVGCEIGECGACTVLLDGEPVYACLLLAVQAHEHHITTIEGIQADDGDYHIMQQAFIEADAIQCGFCSPGMILTSIALLQHQPNPSAEDIQYALSGNLCRCSGYHRIVQAIQLAAKHLPAQSDPPPPQPPAPSPPTQAPPNTAHIGTQDSLPHATDALPEPTNPSAQTTQPKTKP